MKMFLKKFDTLVSPSKFVAERINNYLSEDRVAVLENGYDYEAGAEDDLETAENLSGRFAFFGQVTPFKGIDIFVRAADNYLNRAGNENSDTMFSVYGASRESFLNVFGGDCSEILQKHGSRIQFFGVYDPEQVLSLMRGNGYIVVPSTWWENSPLVIQEAFVAGRPPIVSDIGGMREKVRHQVDGLHFRARNWLSLADVFSQAAGDFDLWQKLISNRKIPPSVQDINSKILEL